MCEGTAFCSVRTERNEFGPKPGVFACAFSRFRNRLPAVSTRVFLEDEIKSNVLQTVAPTNESQKPHGDIALCRSILPSGYAVNPGSVSKIVGEPMVVYHGSKSKHNVYDQIHTFHISNREVASGYGDIVDGNFVNAKNVVEIDADGNDWISIETPKERVGKFDDGEKIDDGRGSPARAPPRPKTDFRLTSKVVCGRVAIAVEGNSMVGDHP